MNSFELDKNKLNTLKNSKGLTLKEISAQTELPISTVEKIFSGANTNPSLKTLRALAKVFDCTLDDIIGYDVEPTSPYYLDRKAGQMAQEIYDNPNLRILFDASKNLAPEDINAIIEVAKRIQATKK